MTKRRIGLSILVLFGTVLLGTAVLGQRALQQLLRDNGIQQLDWQGLDLTLSSLSVDHLVLRQVQPDRAIDIDGRDLRLDWSWHWPGPQANAVTIRQLQLNVQRDDTPNPDSDGPATPLGPGRLPPWLPHSLTVENVIANLPCATGTCALEGALNATRSADGFPLDANLTLNHAGHRVDTRISVDGRWPQTIDLTADMAIDSEQTLTLKTRYQQTKDAGVTDWRGTLDVPKLPQTDWLLAWLKNWQPVAIETLPPQPEDGSLAAQWQLHAPTAGDFFEQVSGKLRIEGHLPQPWPAPGIATVQGNARVSLTADRGQWLPDAVTADLQLSQLADWVKTIPPDLRPKTLSLTVSPPEAATPNEKQPRLPLDLTLKAQGAARIDLTGQIVLATQAPWQVNIRRARLQAQSPGLSRAGWTLKAPTLDARLTGQADTTGLTLSFDPSSSLQAAELRPSDTTLPLVIEGLNANLASQKWHLTYDLDGKTLNTFSLSGPMALAAKQIRHPQLKPQPWTFSGDLNANLQHLAATGTLKSAPGAMADLRIKVPLGGTLVVDGTARLKGAAGAEAWSKTLSAWPDILTLSDGQIDIKSHLTRLTNGALTLHSDATFDKVGGTFNRTAWTGLSGPLTVDVNDGRLSADAASLAIQTVNPGIPIGPVKLSADYKGPIDQPGTGTLRLITAQAAVLDGQVHVAPAIWRLDQRPIKIPLQVERISLAKLMTLYPTENLSGTGTLSGEIPVWIDNGVHVSKGRIRALDPGGRLQLPGERIQAFAQGNAAMEIVADAMKNFHYSVLDSTIEYARDGTLQLGLHIEGKNPDVQRGQPVVLNINLEEDIPALLTSLQLSGRVNETVTERVKKLIRKQQETQDSKH